MYHGNFGKLLFFALISLLGALSIPRIPLKMFSDYAQQSIKISFTLPNATPKIIEKSVTTPIEAVVSTLGGIAKVRSISSYNSGTIYVDLHESSDAGIIRFQIASLLRQIYKGLPEGLTYPTLSIVKSTLGADVKPILNIQVKGFTSSSDIRKFVDDNIKSRLSLIPEIFEIRIEGGQNWEWLVEYNSDQLRDYKISKEDIVESIEQSQLHDFIGPVTTDRGKIQEVIISGETSGLNLNRIAIKRLEGRILMLGDIAKISRKERRAESHFRINGQNAIQMTVFAKPNINQIKLSSLVKRTLSESSIPTGLSIEIYDDIADEIVKNGRRLINPLVALVSTVLFTFLFFTKKLNDIFALVITFMTSLLLMALVFFIFKIELHLNTFGCLIISVCLIGGNTLLAGNSLRYNKTHAVWIGAVATFISILVYSVIWFLPKLAQLPLYDFSVVMTVTSICSWISYSFLFPLLTHFETNDRTIWDFPTLNLANFFRLGYLRVLPLIFRYRTLAAIFFVLWFGLPVFLLPEKVSEKYAFHALYNRTLGNQWYLTNIRPYIDKALGGSLRIFHNYILPNGGQDEGRKRTTLVMDASLPYHSTIEEMNGLMLRIEAQLALHSQIEHYITNVRSGHDAQIVITFKENGTNLNFPLELKSRMVSIASETSGVNWSIYGVGEGYMDNQASGNSQPYTILLKGYNSQVLDSLIALFDKKLQSFPRVVDLHTNRVPGSARREDLYTYDIELNWLAWASKRAPFSKLSAQLMTSDRKMPPDLLLSNGTGESQLISVRPEKHSSFDIFQLNSHPLYLNDSLGIKINEIVRLGKKQSIQEIIKEDQQYLRVVAFNYTGSPYFAKKFILKFVENFKNQLPMGFGIEDVSTDFFFEILDHQYGFMLAAVIAIFLFSAVALESLIYPFVIVLCLPLSFSGIFLSFYYFQLGFDAGGYCSFLFVSSLTVTSLLNILHEMANLEINKARSLYSLYPMVFDYIIGVVKFYLLQFIFALAVFAFLLKDEPFWYSFAIGTLGGLSMLIIVLFTVIPIFFLKVYSVRLQS
jgi:multidrug efflux pump subunit AcrB